MMLDIATFVPLVESLKFKFESYSAKRLKELRTERGLTQEDVSLQAGIPLPTLKKWELGQRTPAIEGLSKLGKFFGVFFFAEWEDGNSPLNPPKSE